jgi:hypothetical protein
MDDRKLSIPNSKTESFLDQQLHFPSAFVRLLFVPCKHDDPKHRVTNISFSTPVCTAQSPRRIIGAAVPCYPAFRRRTGQGRGGAAIDDAEPERVARGGYSYRMRCGYGTCFARGLFIYLSTSPPFRTGLRLERPPKDLYIFRLQPGVALHERRRPRGREDGSPSRVVQRVQHGGSDAHHARVWRRQRTGTIQGGAADSIGS